MNPKSLVLIVTALLVLRAVPSPGAETPPYVVGAPELAEAPKIDGHMDEPVWREAALLDSFTQLEPEEGAPATEKTEVRVGYDAKKLYIAVRCYDSQPDKITSVMMNRDGDLFSEDAIHVVLDTFSDKKTGFLFAVNPLGAQVDALVRGEGDEVNYSWDGIWYSATSRDEEGWTAELAIPFRTLRFPDGDAEQTWGFNVQRSIVSKREYTLWKPVERLGLTVPLYKLSQAGELRGLRNLEQGRSFDLKPYLIARGDRGDTVGEGSSFDVGLDVKKNLTSELVLDLTYNLDFAEVEADNQQVNLTRFKLFFPEKRDFFLEGASLFHFGERPDFLRTPDRIFFFSRQIGLTEDGSRAIPVLGGAKVSGKLGAFNVGFLNLTTEELGYRDRQGVERFEPETNYTVLRLKRNVLEKSYVGLIGLNKAVSGGEDNQGVGLDWDFALGKNVKTGGFLAQTSTPGLEGEDWAATSDVVWDSKYFYGKGVYTEIGENFNPEMGFFTRTGIREWRGTAMALPRPKFWGLRDVLIFDDYTLVEDRDGNLLTRNNRAEVDFQFKSFSTVVFKYFDNVEVIDHSFVISPGVVIPPGQYRFSNWFFGAQTVPGKKVFAFTQIRGGEFWDGTFSSIFVGTRLRPMAGLFSRITFERTDVDLPAGDFVTELLSFRVIYSLSPRLSARLLAEWRKNDNLTVNMAGSWYYKPGAAFYLVYDEFRDLADLPIGTRAVRDRSLIAKVTFFF